MLDGSIGCIEVAYKYRTRSEYAAYIDARIAAETAAAKADEANVNEPAEFSMRRNLERASAAQISFILESVAGWNIDVPFDGEAVKQLADELPAAAAAVCEAYRIAINEGRLGN